jgi:glycosyltransferase involved in cell wall biosynthesis
MTPTEVDLHEARRAPSFGQTEGGRPPEGRRSDEMRPVAPAPARLPLVSVLINNHNYARYLAAAIESALSQDYPAIEVVVVDDGSTDASRDVIASFGDRILPVLKPNGGQGSAFNAGVAASRGDILFFLDADDAFRPGKLERIVRVFRENGFETRPLMVHHLLSLMDGDGNALDTGAHGRTHASPLNLYAFAERYRFIWNEAGPTSGLSINRRLAALLFPIPEREVRICADDFVIGGASLLGELHSLPEIWADYRIHGANNWHGVAPPKSPAFLRSFQDYLNAKLVEDGKRPVISFEDSIYAWDLLLRKRKWVSLIAHMLKLSLRQHDRYTMLFAYYTGMKAARQIKDRMARAPLSVESSQLARRGAERISA